MQHLTAGLRAVSTAHRWHTQLPGRSTRLISLETGATFT